MRRGAILVIACLAALLPSTEGQGTVAIHGIVIDDLGAATAGAAVRIHAGGQFQLNTTNATGRFLFQGVAPGSYRFEVLANGPLLELWHNETRTISAATTHAAPLRLNRTQPFLPRAPSLANATASTPAVVARGVPFSLQLLVRNPAETNQNRTVLVHWRILGPTATVLEDQTSAPFNVTKGSQVWFNRTLAAQGTPAYFEAEGNRTIEGELLANGTRQVLDRMVGLPVRIAGSCAATLVEQRFTFGADTLTVCTPPAATNAWTEWDAEADLLLGLQSTWATRAAQNASSWTAADARTFWTAYQAATKASRDPVVGFLDEQMTDTAGQPTYAELLRVRTAVLEDHELVRAAVAQRLARAHESTNAEETTAGMIWIGTWAVGVLVGAAAGFFLALPWSLRWKREAEYWIGYTATSQPSSPLWGTLVAGVAILLLAVLVAWLVGGFDAIEILWRSD